MSYITIKQEASDEFYEKKSQFIGYAKRVESEEEAKEFVSKIKGMHKVARHNCWAYIVGENMGIQRYSDDGEPQGTAGIPILEVMKKSGITDCAVVVTRYFGGILLGTGGLTRAYTKGASIAIEAAGVVEKVKGLVLKASIDYDLYGKIQYLCNQNNWHIEESDFAEDVKISIICESDLVEKVENDFVEITNGKVVIEKSDEGVYFKEGNRLYENFDF